MNVADQVAQVGSHLRDQLILKPIPILDYLPTDFYEIRRNFALKLLDTVSKWAEQSAIKVHVRSAEPMGGMLHLATLLNTLEEHCLDIENDFGRKATTELQDARLSRYHSLLDLFRWLELVGDKDNELETLRGLANELSHTGSRTIEYLTWTIEIPEHWKTQSLNRKWADWKGYPNYELVDESNEEEFNNWRDGDGLTLNEIAVTVDLLTGFCNREDVVGFAKTMDQSLGEANLTELSKLFSKHCEDFLDDRDEALFFDSQQCQTATERHDRLMMLCSWLKEVAKDSDLQTGCITSDSNWIFEDKGFAVASHEEAVHETCDVLKGQQLKLFRFLVDRKGNTKYSTLQNYVLENCNSDSSISTAIDRFAKSLNDMGVQQRFSVVNEGSEHRVRVEALCQQPSKLTPTPANK